MPKVTEAHRAARREEIIDAAVRCVLRDGYRGVSIASVIQESGLSAGAIYGHFVNKQELLVAVAERVLDGRVADLAAAQRRNGPLSPGELLVALIDGLRHEDVSAAIPQVWAEAAFDDDVRAVAERIFGRVRGILRTELVAWATASPGRVDGDAEEWADLVTPVVLAAVPGFLVQRAILRNFDEAAYLRALPVAYRR
ncbi:TetR/AcrR family transcriptional regulator [Microbacterium sp.]|uniref:TetR/AcrR family transcriptional regulator n=1 Tax=Microbacterium sp. TaxID=51671 RepID=UPI003C71CE28